MRRGVIVFVACLALAGRVAVGQSQLKQSVYDRLDRVRRVKKKQLTDYLARIEAKAEKVGQDELMLAFFDIQNRLYQASRTQPPPAELKREIETLQKRVGDHYLNNYLCFYDILFVNRQGDIVYTIRKETDYHKNIFRGRLAETALSKCLKESPTESFVDYEFYEATRDPSAFIVEPVYKKEKLIGWFVLQCAIRKINSMFSHHKELGQTGEVFLVNRERQMLTDSRFFGETSILKRHLSRRNIEAKFREKKGHKIVTDYRGRRALSSFEVCPVLDSRWLLISKIDEDEVLTEYYQQHKKELAPKLLEAIEKQAPAFVEPLSFEGPKRRVDMDDFRKASGKQVLHTFGVATCTALVAQCPDRTAYMAHLSNYDRTYGGDGTDLVPNIVRRIKRFDLYPYQLGQVRFVIVARHLNSVMGTVDALLEEGFFLSQIRILYNPRADYARVFHDCDSATTLAVWRTENKDTRHHQTPEKATDLGELLKGLVEY